MKKVAVLMGSASDLPVVQKALDTLRRFGVPYEAHVISAHRTPEKAARFARAAAENGFGVLIAAAGKAAHLAGAMAAHSALPVVGIPVGSPGLGGLDALLATVQMPPGLPVATVAVDGAENAALLAVQILALSDEELRRRYAAFRGELTDKALAADEALQSEIEKRLSGV